MSLDKAIQHNKEHRKPFTKSKAFDYTCRNHGSCPYCVQNRTFNDRKRRLKCECDLKEYKKEIKE